MSILDYYVDDLNKYRSKGILVDTGPLLLFFVGLYDQNQIGQSSCTRSHTIAHFHLLYAIVREFKTVVTTPNILTEVCDLLGHLPDPRKKDILSKFVGPGIDKMDEKYTRSSELGKNDYFNSFGLADASIVNTAKGDYLVLTEDLALYNYLKKEKIAVVNFAHLCYNQ